MNFKPMIGIETHIELSTKTKLFCSCENSFSGTPGSRCCPVCTGMPGAMPELNMTAVKYAVMAGLALRCKINNKSGFARKNYFYPDLPKAFQITQGELPLCQNGRVLLSDGKEIRIKRIHIEEDAGKLLQKDKGLVVDYNRCGVPLIEIVTEPDFESADQVKEYVETLRGIMKTLKVSDCRMQEGSMRCDVNISLLTEETNYPKTELKNLNSVSFIAKGINAEIERQQSVIEAGGEIEAETRRFNEKTFKTESMRKKESYRDYRYIKEPDLPDLYISEGFIEDIKKEMPLLPAERIKKFVEDYDISPDCAEWIVKYPRVAEYFECLVEKTGEGKLCAKIITGNLFSVIKKETARENAEFPKAEYIEAVINHIKSGLIKSYRVNEVINNIIMSGKPFELLYNEEDFNEIEFDELKKICLEEIAKNKKAAEDYVGGSKKAASAIVGAVMRRLDGKADAGMVQSIISEALE